VCLVCSIRACVTFCQNWYFTRDGNRGLAKMSIFERSGKDRSMKQRRNAGAGSSDKLTNCAFFCGALYGVLYLVDHPLRGLLKLPQACHVTIDFIANRRGPFNGGPPRIPPENPIPRENGIPPENLAEPLGNIGLVGKIEEFIPPPNGRGTIGTKPR
jgi:hypothetical protein